jgi:tRNA-Thr(GGU) m(6)t(6)A37 methyltransferase TsaA
MAFEFEPIGIIHSCFKEKFGIPRQAPLVPAARASLELLPPYNRPEALKGLEDISHLWVLFLFHQCLRDEWKPTVRPPRLGGNRRLGVFASRSPFRPNPLGMSAVELLSIEHTDNRLQLHLRGVDMMDGTPVLDIKPYVPYADSLPSAKSGFAPLAPEPTQRVRFSEAAEEFLNSLEEAEADYLRRLTIQVLEQDPRPAYLVNDVQRTSFGMHLCEYNLRWTLDGEYTRVTAIQSI